MFVSTAKSRILNGGDNPRQTALLSMEEMCRVCLKYVKDGDLVYRGENDTIVCVECAIEIKTAVDNNG